MLVGQGNTTGCLDDNDIRSIVIQGMQQADVGNKRVLILIPDSTRTAPIPAFFRTFYEVLLDPQGAPVNKVAALDYLVALGTHQPMSDEALNRLVGITAEERTTKYAGVHIYNHRWDDPKALSTIGTIPAEEIRQISNGLMAQDVPVTVNRLIFDYDVLIICGPTFPHEVVGFSGGNKYFFPGISGPEVINFTHWLGAVITSYEVIGTRYTPVRAVIDRAASMIDRPKLCFSLVVRHDRPSHSAGTGTVTEPGSIEPTALTDAPVQHESCLAGLFAGTPEEAYAAAAELSSRLHVQWVDKPFRRVLSMMPEMYDDIWTAAKGMYKLEPAVADGGEVIIYAPHITEVSYTHGSILDQIGYHCRDYFLKQWDRFKNVPWGVLAHSTHLRGQGTYDPATGVEHDRIQVTLATGIPKERCERLNLGYIDPATINPEDWANREDEGVLLVRRAGEMLYRVEPATVGPAQR